MEMANTRVSGSSRSMERFPSDDPHLVEFKSHLMGIGGKRRKPSSADAIVAEISKMVYFGGPDDFDWTHLINVGKVKAYMEKMQEMKIGPEGQLTKLERLCDALDYLKYYYQDGRLAEQVAKIEIHVSKWKRVLRTEKQELNIARLEKTSEEDLDMSIITNVVDNPQMWSTFDSIVEKIQEGEDISDDELKLAMGSVMITLVLKNYQRPGAVSNCTIQEYQDSKIVNDDAFVIRVASHKTSSKFGAAKLVMDVEMKERVDAYFNLVRPKLVKAGADIPNLFILPGSRPIEKIANLSRFLQGKLKIKIPTCTRARKIGTTSAARTLDEKDNLLISAQMSHSPAVARKYYTAITAPRDAVTVYKKMEGMRTMPDSPNVQITSCGPSMPSPLIPGKWSNEDTRCIEKLFAKHIALRKPPPLKDCASKARHFPTRTTKQIQDKVRTTIRQMVKADEANQDSSPESAGSFSNFEDDSD